MKILLYFALTGCMWAAPLSVEKLVELMNLPQDRAIVVAGGKVVSKASDTIQLSFETQHNREELYLNTIGGAVQSITWGIDDDHTKQKAISRLFLQVVGQFKELGFIPSYSAASVDGSDLFGRVPLRTNSGVYLALILRNESSKMLVDVSMNMMPCESVSLSIFLQRIDGGSQSETNAEPANRRK